MRKLLLIFLALLFLTSGLIGCGGSGKTITTTTTPPPPPPHQSIAVSISPTNTPLLVNQATQFSATVTGSSNPAVTWSIQEQNGGYVSGGIYQAPNALGTFHVVATSVADPTKSATATVPVSAMFAFMEEYPAGAALPFSMTARVGTYAPDGSLTISEIIDQGTGSPVSIAMESLVLSGDGTKAVFDVAADTGSAAPYPSDIYLASTDGSDSPVQLTADGISWYPQFSADGRQILFMRGDDIWMMDADGSNQHLVFSAGANNTIYSATLSPDGTTIAAELEWNVGAGSDYYDGIAIMNADGSNPVALTGGPDLTCSGYDEMPSFTPDGTKILFSRYCEAGQNSSESLYSVYTDGTGVTQLLGADSGIALYNPISVGENILYQSNQDFPSSFSFEIYSLTAGGSAVSRITDNTVYDGFDTSWYHGPSAAASAQVANRNQAARPLQGFAKRTEKLKKLQLHRR